MKNKSSISILAAFATIKTLNEKKQYTSPYRLLSEFVNFIICEKKMFSFTAIEMKNQLSTVFGFQLPEAVVKTAIKTIDFVSKQDNTYTVDNEYEVVGNNLQELMLSAENDNLSVLKKISTYITEKFPEKEIIEEELNADLISFLIDDQYKSTGKYTSIISEFVLKNEKNSELQSVLNAIREGNILYIGMNHNINEIGSLTKPITLFLDVEVLFSLAGFNGEVYKTLAHDFYDQVRIANSTERKISLRYFSETKKEIDSFFGTAESIVEGKIKISNKPAMRVIVNGCSTATDVQIKKADFFHKLQTNYGIVKDANDDYYTPDLNQYNLESKENIDEQEKEGWKYVSHINKLRKGKNDCNCLDSKYLFVTNTYNILKVSRKQVLNIKEKSSLEHISDFAVNVNKITNVLWYKLGNSFGGKELPNNINSVLKARLVLASNIANNVEKVYNEMTEQYKNGEITDEQLAARIITLRDKPVFPEELEGDQIEESMDFSSEYLSRFEEEVKANKNKLQEKDDLIKRIEEEKQKETDKNKKAMAEKDIALQESEKRNKILQLQLDTYKQKELQKQKRQKVFKNILLFLWSIIWKGTIFAGVVVAGIYIQKVTEKDVFKYIFGVVDLFGFLIFAGSVLKGDIKKYFRK